MKEYRKRVVDDYFKARMRASGAILIEGPRWCGKTTTGEHLTASSLYMQDEDNRELYMYYASTKPSELLKGEKPRLIDEWQVAPNLWNTVRFAVDRGGEMGQFVLTGSSVPSLTEEQIRSMHSGTGRIASTRMRTMSLFESGDSSGSVSLKGLFEGGIPEGAPSNLTLERIAQLVCRGGWPSTIGLDERDSLRTAKDYLESVVNTDISRADNKRRNPDIARALMMSLSRNICTLAETTAITADMGGYADRKTVSDYIGALRKIFVVEDVPPWSPALMSKTRLRRSVKRDFVDPSIAAAALNAGPDRLLKETSAFGQLFESLCIRDLRVYSQPLDGKVYHYHDNMDLEVDAVVELDDGRWGAVEVKLMSGEDKAADNLLKLKKRVSLKSGEGPSFLAVLTATGFPHVREDGVLVVPIGCLRDRSEPAAAPAVPSAGTVPGLPAGVVGLQPLHQVGVLVGPLGGDLGVDVLVVPCLGLRHRLGHVRPVHPDDDAVLRGRDPGAGAGVVLLLEEPDGEHDPVEPRQLGVQPRLHEVGVRHLRVVPVLVHEPPAVVGGLDLQDGLPLPAVRDVPVDQPAEDRVVVEVVVAALLLVHRLLDHELGPLRDADGPGKK